MGSWSFGGNRTFIFYFISFDNVRLSYNAILQVEFRGQHITYTSDSPVWLSEPLQTCQCSSSGVFLSSHTGLLTVAKCMGCLHPPSLRLGTVLLPAASPSPHRPVQLSKAVPRSCAPPPRSFSDRLSLGVLYLHETPSLMLNDSLIISDFCIAPTIPGTQK